jgi:ankyrin repeat protein
MGATPLFYAICNNDRDIVELLLRHDARLDAGMQGENEVWYQSVIVYVKKLKDQIFFVFNN